MVWPQHPGHRRFTPRTEPEAALPDGGRWLPLPVHYGSPLHRTVTYPLPLDARGQPLCITCAAALSLALRPSVFRFLAAQCGPDTSTGTQTSTSDALRTDTTDPCGPPGMVCSENDMFCSGPCRLQYFIKRNGALLRRQLFQLERGVCRSCGLGQAAP